MQKNWGQRLGCAGKLVNKPVSDNRKFKPLDTKNNPSLKKSCEIFSSALDYMDEINLRLFRIPSTFCPYATHPKHPELHFENQLDYAQEELEVIKQKLQQYKIKVSFHPTQFILLSSPKEQLTQNSVKDLEWQTKLLDIWERPKGEFVFLHGGGVYGEREITQKRIIKNILDLPKAVKHRFALENDEYGWSVEQLLPICLETKTPLIFDIHHHRLNPGKLNIEEALQLVKTTWPKDVEPKVHLSSSKVKEGSVAKRRAHADYIDVLDAQILFEACENTNFTPWVMLEAKAKENAVLKLRKDLEQVV